MSEKSIRRIGVIANTEKSACRNALTNLPQIVERLGGTVVFEQRTAAFAGVEIATAETLPALADASDLILVFGGDGTILRIARHLVGDTTPIMGVNIGRLGFLTSVVIEELETELARIFAGEFQIEGRSMIEAEGIADGKPYRQCAFNDVVISRGNATRMIELEVRVDGGILTRYRCDGLIVSTPTGSTAYALAAGGAIVSPKASVINITPISPHTLTNRSVILDDSARIEITALSSRTEIVVSADGQVDHAMTKGETIAVKRSSRRVHILQPSDHSFFETLRKKLHWTGSNVS